MLRSQGKLIVNTVLGRCHFDVIMPQYFHLRYKATEIPGGFGEDFYIPSD
jgi:hypothetical protein